MIKTALKSITRVTFLVAACLFPASGPALAGHSDYDQGVALYAQAKYGAALPALESAVKSSPRDASSHYYLALCYLALKQSTLARQQFEWVSKNSADPTLTAYATSALNSIHAPAASGTLSSGSAVSQAVDGAPAPQKKLGRCKALMFETSWCHYCHEFAPHFDQVAGQNRSSMDFQRLDAEDPANAAAKQKYQIHSYPRLVYLDGNGNVLYNEGRAMFDRRVQELTEK